MKTDIARTLAALNATNEAILYAKSPEELYAKVCEAAFSVGDFLAVAVFLLEREGNLLRFAAGCGDDVPRLRSIDISIAAGTPEGSGVAGQAFRDGRVCVSNDFLNDPRSLAWRDGAKAGQVGAAAALPLLCNGESVGVLLVSRPQAHSIDGQLVSMLERVSANVSFALDNFDHEAARKNGERAMRRLNRMFGAISATNEAILRAKTEQDLYQRVCDAAVHSGKSAATVVLLAEPDSIWLKPAAGTGAIVEQIMRAPFSIDAGNPYGTGVCGKAFRTQQPAVNNDILSSTQGQPWHQAARETGVTACVAVPLIKADESIGVLLFFVGKLWAEDEEIVALMAQIAENVSFALENFERASEKARADAQKERLARMLAALSATNEAIVRATSRAELFDLVCEASAKGGRFNSTSILLARPDSYDVDLVAVAGPTANNMRRVKVSTNADLPEGRGLCGNAFRSRRACIANDLRADPRGSAFRQFIHSDGAMSGAAFPLLISGQAVGVMFFISSEKDTFTPEFAELLQRLTENVSFALENFDRADEKARTESQKKRLTRMFAALSRTNEAIMRAKSRTELFDLVCEAAAEGGRFTSTTIALATAGSDLLRIVAASGPAAETTRHVRLSTDESRPEGRGLSGTAFRTRRPCITNDYGGDQRVAAFQAVVGSYGAQSGAAFPLLVRDEPVGIMIYMSLDKDTFTPEFVELLQRLADNVSFALENFDRADDKARTEIQKERLTRMLAALSATNEAIIRATSRAELFELVCEAAANGGKFTLTSIVLAKPESDYLDVVAAAGPTALSARLARISASEAHPEGRGLCGQAIRSQRPCIINDYLADPNAEAFHHRARLDGTNSGAAFPLLVHGKAVGVMSFMSLEKDTFTTEFAELLQRLVDNVSFALENFERADERTRADERIEYLASHDSLTNLPNREMFSSMLRRAIDTAARYQRQFALLFIDLDRFKVINDSLGHDAGDMLLVEIGGRLRRALRSSDIVARLGGDEFVVILEETAERHEVERIAGELLSILSQPLQLSGHECQTTASIGIAMYPSDGADMQTLTKNADMAMYLAKEDGKNGFRFFTKEIKTQSIERLTLESALRRALERDQFSLHYQPKIDMESRQITGVEALLRWNHPELGTVSPGQFIPLAEETGSIVPIGRWVLKEACAQNMAWQRRGLRPVTMAVNLSPRQFADPHLLHDVDEALLASGMSPVLLQLEVTESMVMRNVSRAIKILDAIQSRGIRLAIDDFGTGYSSMSLMKQFPIDTIKIDRSFVRDLPVDSEDQAIAQAIISMGKALGMTVIAEGVETIEQEVFLRNHACDEMQGFLFSKPLPAKQMADLLRAEPRLSSPPLQPEAGSGLKRTVG
ncbi:bifunctional diguanylate cyclase/phosphodiesterase [Bradyrhizobium australiense]|uniref:GAF domain-containing protein n=1 Tax=Bradyrhizobium australiense TaxID=2721161 RepID=A0A7Y4GV40_9BRAD|nr:GAF domain-containing protein [Bradyrhizobium australiense]NOJ42461.1 GAF domain-containing protein [Bradyrhizobium australiense]